MLGFASRCLSVGRGGPGQVMFSLWFPPVSLLPSQLPHKQSPFPTTAAVNTETLALPELTETRKPRAKANLSLWSCFY